MQSWGLVYGCPYEPLHHQVITHPWLVSTLSGTCVMTGIELVPLNAVCWVSRGEGVETKYSTSSPWRPCFSLVMLYLLLLWLWILAFLCQAFLIYLLIQFWMLWTYTWNIQQRWSLFVCILYCLRLYGWTSMYKKSLAPLHVWWWRIRIRIRNILCIWTPLDNEHFYTLNVFSLSTKTWYVYHVMHCKTFSYLNHMAGMTVKWLK